MHVRFPEIKVTHNTAQRIITYRIVKAYFKKFIYMLYILETHLFIFLLTVISFKHRAQLLLNTFKL